MLFLALGGFLLSLFPLLSQLFLLLLVGFFLGLVLFFLGLLFFNLFLFSGIDLGLLSGGYAVLPGLGRHARGVLFGKKHLPFLVGRQTEWRRHRVGRGLEDNPRLVAAVYHRCPSNHRPQCCQRIVSPRFQLCYGNSVEKRRERVVNHVGQEALFQPLHHSPALREYLHLGVEHTASGILAAHQGQCHPIVGVESRVQGVVGGRIVHPRGVFHS